ncbi:site-specific DNA-methyltransferase [Capnocytophaga sp. ARDL2]|uniref:site-specific DNA-methyltransferase n=1 Tax=Capnocytophaga sp. ARDL2 TaxID=3238809 RepID=UPI0035576235
MNDKQAFINQGFSVLNTENQENKLKQFLKENYPSVLKDGGLNLAELKNVLGLPIDEKVNGYGLNFVGRGVARAKYAQETQKELLLNRTLSKNIDTTQNMVLKGDNLDSLKLLKPHYSGKIKCIYIDPPYNTSSDEFVYPDKFDRHEAQVLGVADSLSDEDFDRMEFSFKTKKSHNGWLTFMYPRLLLARDLLAKDGVIFISIDDNEQANLKILCDEIFGEENFIELFSWVKTETPANLSLKTKKAVEYILCYQKNKDNTKFKGLQKDSKSSNGLMNQTNSVKELIFPANIIDTSLKDGVYEKGEYGTKNYKIELLKDVEVRKGFFITPIHLVGKFKWSQQNLNKEIDLGTKISIKTIAFSPSYERLEYEPETPWNLINPDFGVATNETASIQLEELLQGKYFDYSKPISLIKYLIDFITKDNDIILDFFAGSGTTGHAVMALNAEDGGNRKFILCQIDEPIAEGKPAYQFCKDNGLPPVISSITIERLRRVSSLNPSEGGTSNKGKAPSLSERAGGEEFGEDTDYGFKVFDHTDAPQLTQDENGQIQFPTLHQDALSRIYTMIFKVGLDEPSEAPQEVIENCIYKIGNHYYITNSEQITKDDFATTIKDATQNSGKIFVDGWTASLNATLQHYKEEVQIVF